MRPGEFVCDRHGQGMRSRPAQRRVHRFQPADQIDDVAPLHGTAGRAAKMGAAAKRTILVNEATSGPSIKHRTISIGGCRKRLSAGRTPAAGGHKRLAAREERDAPGEFELTALRPQSAIPTAPPTEG